MDLEYSTSSLIHCSGTWPTFVVLLQSFVGLNSSSSPQNELKQLKITANFQSVQILQSLFTFNYINCCCHSESDCDLKENSQKVFSRIRERICRRICLRQSQRPNLRFYWNNLQKLLQVIIIDINNLRFNWNNHRKLFQVITIDITNLRFLLEHCSDGTITEKLLQVSTLTHYQYHCHTIYDVIFYFAISAETSIVIIISKIFTTIIINTIFTIIITLIDSCRREPIWDFMRATFLCRVPFLEI